MADEIHVIDIEPSPRIVDHIGEALDVVIDGQTCSIGVERDDAFLWITVGDEPHRLGFVLLCRAGKTVDEHDG